MKTIIDTFESQVKKTPDATALIYKDKEISYKELNKKANGLARYLLENYRIKNDTIIAILIDKSEWMIVAILGVLKAGAAYLPLDSHYPKERIKYMLTDAGTQLLLTDKPNSEHSKVYANSLGIGYCEIEALAHKKTKNIKKEISSKALAYLIYTSGTTGKPKGVMIEHGTFINMMMYQIKSFNITKEDNVIQFASFSFDASVYETFLALLSGATFVIVSKNELLNDFVNLSKKYKITVAVLNPSFLANVEALEGFKVIITAGEKAIVSDALKYAKKCTYINAYGPTEASICSTFYKVNPDKNYEVIPIGKDITNSKIYILDKALNEVKNGLVGEMYIAGKGLARGYLGREDLTNEKFIMHPKFGRVYQSGDVGKFLQDGNLVYLGRVDEQIKIHGHRIELGEIENSILEYPSIKECVVLEKNKKLWAYYREDKKKEELINLKEFLASELPAYMIPSYFHKLEKFPLTSNGKVDKKSLASSKVDLGDKRLIVPPFTETEKKFFKLFMEILDHQEISIEDDFFHLGGNSLQAMWLINTINRAFNVQMTINDLNAHQNIKALSTFITSKSRVLVSNIIPLIEGRYYPLSSSQERIWTIHKMQQKALATYNLPVTVGLDRVDVLRLEASIYKLIERHEILRTNFIEIENRPKQVISRYPKSDVFEVVKVKEQDTYIQEESKKVFDLTEGSLFVAKLINDNILFINMHHIISDGWSMRVMMNDLSAIYEDLVLEPLSIGYKEYAVWQNKQLEDEVFIGNHQTYWHSLLEDYKKLNFPLDFPRTNHQTFDGEVASIVFDSKTMMKLKALSKKRTLFTTLIGITNILLAKYTNENDILIGIPVANRNDEALLNQVGLYVNTVPLRVRLDNEGSFSDNLEMIKALIFDIFTHQSYPFDKLVNAIEQDKDLSQNPLFNVMVVLQDNKNLKGMFRNYENVSINQAKFDITFEYIQKEDDLELRIEYNANLLAKSTIEKIALNLQNLILNIEEDTCLAEIDFISMKEKKLLKKFNKTKKHYPKEDTIVSLFEKQVVKHPKMFVTFFENQSLTYSELNAKSNKVAHFLIEEGLLLDEVVAIKIERSLEMVIAIMAIMKAGGAYLPIDTEHPKDRIDYIIENAKAKFILTAKDVEEKCLGHYSNENPETRLKPKHLAYVIYTSGSTGRPKGVMLEHRGLINRIDWMQKEYNLTTEDVILQKTPYSFDVSVWELLLPLVYGVKQVIAKPEGHKDNKYLVELIQQESVTFLHFVPSMLNAMLSAKGLEKCDSIKNIVCSGEALSARTVNDFYTSTSGITLHNLYGPTEASIDVSSFICRKNKVLSSVPIGKAIANIKLYVLDKYLNQVPIGAIGELHIKGVGLARGYLNSPELTEDKFIVHKLLGRIYKSGDLAKYSEDGNIEYLGRIDEQVKLRGFRIELGEIENTLLAYSEVKSAVVLVKDNQLIAYIIVKEHYNELALKQHLRTKLSAYMIPNHIMELKSFPLTANGKLNKKALPLVQVTQDKADIVEASTVNEKMLLEIFEDVLNIKNISMNDNFFFIGGDSIKAIQIISKLNALGFALEIKDIFYHPSIFELAQILNQESIEIIDQSKVSGDFKLIPIQKFFIENFKNINHFNQYLLLEAKGNIDFNHLANAFKVVIEHHDILRSRFMLRGEEYIQVIEEESQFELEHISSKENMSEIIKEANASFYIQEGNLIKAILFGNHTLFITIHHLIMDGIGLRILMESIEKAYQGLPLAQKTISFKKWSDEIYSYANAGKINEDYWNKIEPYRVFDTKIEAKVANKEQLKFTLDKSLINTNYKLSSILLLAFAKVLYERTKKDKFSIITEGHGREDVLGLNVSRTIGWFTTLFISNIEYIPSHVTTQLEHIENAIELLHNGFDYGILKHISKQELTFEPEIAFNYLGEVHLENDTIFDIKELALSSSYKNDRIAPIEVESLILDELIVFIAFDNSLASLFKDFDLSFKEELMSIMQELNSNKTYSLSYAQKGLFMIESLNAGFSVYNETASFGFNENLDVNVLEKSFQLLIERHDILRTSFVSIDGIPKQTVLDYVPFEIESENLNNQNLEKVIEAFDMKPFNLSTPPLLRAKLLKLKSKKYILLITFHHIIIDGWSLNVVLNDLKEFYNSMLLNQESALKVLKVQYRDFVSFSHTLLKRSDTDKLFWMDKLENIKVIPYIPYDFTNKRTHEGGLVRMTFEAKLSQKIRKLAKENATSLFSVLVSLLDILFHLYSDEKEVVMATPIANSRDKEMFQNQIGVYLNTLVLRSEIQSEKSFRETVSTVSTDIIEAFNHQNYPFDKIIEDLEVTTPLFNIMVILQNFEKQVFDFHNSEFEILDNVNYGSKFDLKFEFEDNVEIALMIEYSVDLFEEKTVKNLGDNLKKLIEYVSEDITIESLGEQLQLNKKIEINQEINEDF
ncbi:MAG: Non-ribosomal peptide synthetase [uncultured Sulfurovum sp.]|uniref:Non-ribosomal peptide synthetase n=1 Tax=uncultured Sulfurovum sp. TaxID=269237 RepID=A0A6S6RY66_9BACT|nr:MAG: Non-ribosomal peptide synthetase [uncultured Sulfurovum sp.]